MGGKNRFRIPWISGSSKERPPFRPPGIAYSPPTTGMNKKTEERKMMFAAIATSNQDIKVVDTNPVTNNKNNNDDEDVSNLLVNKIATTTVNPTTEHPPIPMDEKSVSVVTLAGENRGATMHVSGGSGTRSSQSTRKKELLSINKHREEEDEDEDDEAGKAYVNSNIQSMNNSMMLHGSINGRDPGVRVTFPKPILVQGGGGGGLMEENNNNNNSTKKGELNSNNNRLSYTPMVQRRRCLRGLFHEPSDSDPDNPNKPRRHGCKFNCGGDVTKG